MAIDPAANAEFHKAKNIPFAVGQRVWIDRIEFRVTGYTTANPALPNGQLILVPVTAKV